MPKTQKSKIKGVTFGNDVSLVEPVNLYNCFLDDSVFVGPFVEIQSDVKIGKRTKIQSHSFICSKVEIGSDTFIGHGVMFINDVFEKGSPAAGDKSLWKSTFIGSKVSIGSNSTILPVNICDNVVVGAGSVVTKNINRAGIYAGNPAEFLRSL